MDELGRILLPTELCKQLGWTTGRKVTTAINKTNKSLSILAADDGKILIDDLSRVKIDEDTCSELDWKADKISISLSTDGLHLVLEQTTM